MVDFKCRRIWRSYFFRFQRTEKMDSVTKELMLQGPQNFGARTSPDSIACWIVTRMTVLWINRRKRAVTDNDDSSNDGPVTGPRVSDGLITSTDNVSAPPDRPIHQFTKWPTPSNINEENATDLCDRAIKATPLYNQCLNYSVEDRTAFIDSCVADILVTTCCLNKAFSMFYVPNILDLGHLRLTALPVRKSIYQSISH